MVRRDSTSAKKTERETGRAFRSALLVLPLLAAGGTGCFSTITIPIEQAAALVPGGTVRTEKGVKIHAEDVTSVEPVASNGDSGDATSASTARDREEAERRLRVAGPIRVEADGDLLRIEGRLNSIEIDPKQFTSLRVTRYSPRKTAGLVCGLTFGVIGAAGIVAGIVALSELGGIKSIGGFGP